MSCGICGQPTRRLGVMYVDGAPFYEEVCGTCGVSRVGSRLPVPAQTVTEVREVSSQVESQLAARKFSPVSQLDIQIAKLRREIAEMEGRREQAQSHKRQSLSDSDRQRLAARRSVAEAAFTLGSAQGLSPEELAKALVGGAYAPRSRQETAKALEEKRAHFDDVVTQKRALQQAAAKASADSMARLMALRNIQIT